MKNTLLLTTFALLSAASAAAQGTVTTQPITPTSYPWSFTSPPVGLAYTETLQVNVANQSVVLGISPVGVCTLCGQSLGSRTRRFPLPAMTLPRPSDHAGSTNSCTGTITLHKRAGDDDDREACTVHRHPGPDFLRSVAPFSMTGYSGFRGEVVARRSGNHNHTLDYPLLALDFARNF